MQAISPSVVAGANAGTEPTKTAHRIGQAIGCVTLADQPPVEATPKATVTPVVIRMFNELRSLVYAVSLPVSATWDFRYADRIRRARARVRTYLRLRRNPLLHRRLLDELTWLRKEATMLDELVGRGPLKAAGVEVS